MIPPLPEVLKKWIYYFILKCDLKRGGQIWTNFFLKKASLLECAQVLVVTFVKLNSINAHLPPLLHLTLLWCFVLFCFKLRLGFTRLKAVPWALRSIWNKSSRRLHIGEILQNTPSPSSRPFCCNLCIRRDRCKTAIEVPSVQQCWVSVWDSTRPSQRNHGEK